MSLTAITGGGINCIIRTYQGKYEAVRLGLLGRWWDAPGSGWNHGPSEMALMGMNHRIHSKTWACQSLKQDDLARKELQGSWTQQWWRSEEAKEWVWMVSHVGCSESMVTCGC